MSDNIEDIKSEVHSMRMDFKDLGLKITQLTEVMIRKEEQDKYLETRVEKLEQKDAAFEARVRATEDFITKSNPWLALLSRMAILVAGASMLIWLGLK